MSAPSSLGSDSSPTLAVIQDLNSRIFPSFVLGGLFFLSLLYTIRSLSSTSGSITIRLSVLNGSPAPLPRTSVHSEGNEKDPHRNETTSSNTTTDTTAAPSISLFIPNLITVLNTCLAISSLSKMLSLLTFNLKSGTSACAASTALAGTFGGVAGTLALVQLAFELKSLGVPHWESRLFFCVTAFLSVIVCVGEAVTLSKTTLTPASPFSFGFCDPTFNVPLSTIISTVGLLCNVYTCARIFAIVIPDSLSIKAQVRTLYDIRVVQSISLLVLNILNFVPVISTPSVTAETIPFAIGGSIVIVLFNYVPRKPKVSSAASVSSRSGPVTRLARPLSVSSVNSAAHTVNTSRTRQTNPRDLDIEMQPAMKAVPASFKYLTAGRSSMPPLPSPSPTYTSMPPVPEEVEEERRPPQAPSPVPEPEIQVIPILAPQSPPPAVTSTPKKSNLRNPIPASPLNLSDRGSWFSPSPIPGSPLPDEEFPKPPPSTYQQSASDRHTSVLGLIDAEAPPKQETSSKGMSRRIVAQLSALIPDVPSFPQPTRIQIPPPPPREPSPRNSGTIRSARPLSFLANSNPNRPWSPTSAGPPSVIDSESPWDDDIRRKSFSRKSFKSYKSSKWNRSSRGSYEWLPSPTETFGGFDWETATNPGSSLAHSSTTKSKSSSSMRTTSTKRSRIPKKEKSGKRRTFARDGAKTIEVHIPKGELTMADLLNWGSDKP